MLKNNLTGYSLRYLVKNKNRWMINNFIEFYNESYLEITLCCFLNMTDRNNQTRFEAASLILSFVSLILVSMVPIIIYIYFLNSQKQIYEHQMVKHQLKKEKMYSLYYYTESFANRKMLIVESLYNKLKILNTQNTFQNLLTQVFYYGRRFAICAALVLFEDKFAQWGVFFMACAFILVRNYELRPYNKIKLQITHHFHETILIIILILLPPFEYITDSNDRFILGWVVNALVLLDIACMLIFVLTLAIQKIIKICRKRRQNKTSKSDITQNIDQNTTIQHLNANHTYSKSAFVNTSTIEKMKYQDQDILESMGDDVNFKTLKVNKKQRQKNKSNLDEISPVDAFNSSVRQSLEANGPRGVPNIKVSGPGPSINGSSENKLLNTIQNILGSKIGSTQPSVQNSFQQLPKTQGGNNNFNFSKKYYNEGKMPFSSQSSLHPNENTKSQDQNNKNALKGNLDDQSKDLKSISENPSSLLNQIKPMLPLGSVLKGSRLDGKPQKQKTNNPQTNYSKIHPIKEESINNLSRTGTQQLSDLSKYDFNNTLGNNSNNPYMNNHISKQLNPMNNQNQNQNTIDYDDDNGMLSGTNLMDKSLMENSGLFNNPYTNINNRSKLGRNNMPGNLSNFLDQNNNENELNDRDDARSDDSDVTEDKTQRGNIPNQQQNSIVPSQIPQQNNNNQNNNANQKPEKEAWYDDDLNLTDMQAYNFDDNLTKTNNAKF
eukprot:403350980